MAAAPELPIGLLDNETDVSEAPIRERKRPDPLKLTPEERDRIVQRVIEFADSDEHDRYHDYENRRQREAKLKMWQDERNFPWEGAQPVALSDMMEACLRMQDTLQNAALATRPMMNAQAQDKANREKERALDLWHDHQFFVQQPGERLVENVSVDFINEGQYRIHSQWVRESRKTTQLRTFSPIPFGVKPADYFEQLLFERWQGIAEARPLPDSDGWDWKVRDADEQWYQVRFYTTEDPPGVEMEIQADLVVFDGPCLSRVPYERVLHPVACENLQAPGPSNPYGAAHVILVDYPTVDECRRLIRAGVYDLIEESELDERVQTQTVREPDLEHQKLEMRGYEPNSDTRCYRHDAKNQSQLVRLTCYDLWAKDGEGESQDVVWTVLEDMQKLARAKPLGEVSPGNPPRRPIAEGVCIPIPGQCTGMGIPELMEALHDWETKITEQMIDAADVEITPFGTYRASSSINPEEYHIAPGKLLPQSQQGDISFERIAPTSGAIAINQISLIQQKRERLVSISDLQFGKIPSGKSAALRTSSGINQVLAQGEARPERLLRRFFLGLRDTFHLMFQLNRFYLDKKRVFRATGAVRPEEDPWISIDKADFSGRFDFDFSANVLNTSKAALQDALSQVLTLALSPLMLELGISTPESLFRITQDWVRALGQQPDKYLNEPTPGAGDKRLLAEEALAMLLRGEFPIGRPMEPAEQHMQKLQQLLQGKDADGLSILQAIQAAPEDGVKLQVYLQIVAQRIAEEQAAQQQLAQADQLAQQLQQQEPGTPSAPGRTAGQGSGTLNGGGEALDESLPQGTGTPQ